MSNGILVSTLGAALLGSVSGCTCDTTVEPGIDALIQNADRQLYLAKGAGRNTVAAALC